MLRRSLLFLIGIAIFGQAVPDRYIVELSSAPAERVKARGERERLRSQLRSEAIEELDSFGTVLNAIVVRADERQRDKLQRMPGVLRVHPDREMQMLLDRAVLIHGAPAAWLRLGGIENAGAGIKIGIIDTGIDATHPGFQDSSLSVPDGFPKVLTDTDTAYTNNKVIVARAYQGTSAADVEGHGTAVAMAAAGVLHESPVGPISGVAPKAWLGSYKVFRDGGGAPTSSVIHAIEDAIADGMDVINLSLGSNLAADPQIDPMARAVESAVSQGVIVVVAAGNAGPDAMTVGTPGSAASAITVANTSSDRDFGGAMAFDDGRSYVAIPGDSSRNLPPVSGPIRSVFEVDSTGLACSELPPNSFQGNIVFVMRGTCTFAQKFDVAERAGAIGVIVATDASRPDPITMSLDTARLAGVMLGYADGTLVRSTLQGGPVNGTLNFTIGPVRVDPNRLDSSSSRGPNVDFTIKPDVAAVGSPLVTASPGGGYVAETGTSLSSPLVAGGAALIKQLRPGLTVAQYRSLLVNSARKLTLTGQSFTSVRAAGSGVMDLDLASQSTVTANPVSLSFGLIQSAGDVSRDLTLTNLGDTTDTFLLSVDSLARPISPQFSNDVLQLDPKASATIQVRVPVPAVAAGTVEGFVVIKSGNTGKDIRVPYWMGAPSEYAQAVTVLDSPASGFAGSQQLITFRVTDESGIPVTQVKPDVTARRLRARRSWVSRAPA